MNSRQAVLPMAAALLLSGCISYSSPAPPVMPVAPIAAVCMYAGQPYSPGAKVYPPNSAPLRCRADGSWYPG